MFLSETKRHAQCKQTIVKHRNESNRKRGLTMIDMFAAKTEAPLDLREVLPPPARREIVSTKLFDKKIGTVLYDDFRSSIHVKRYKKRENKTRENKKAQNSKGRQTKDVRLQEIEIEIQRLRREKTSLTLPSFNNKNNVSLTSLPEKGELVPLINSPLIASLVLPTALEDSFKLRKKSTKASTISSVRHNTPTRSDDRSTVIDSMIVTRNSGCPPNLSTGRKHFC